MSTLGVIIFILNLNSFGFGSNSDDETFKVLFADEDRILQSQTFTILMLDKVVKNSSKPEGHCEIFRDEDVIRNSLNVARYSDTKGSLQSCYNQTERISNLIVYPGFKSVDTFKAFFNEMITREVTKLENKRRKSYCQILIPFHSCETRAIQNIFSEQMPSAYDFPFQWYSDLYVIQFCRYQLKLKIWEVYSLKNKLFINLVGDQRRNKAENYAFFNFTAFHFNLRPKVMRRRDLKEVDVVASAFLEEGNENDNRFELELEKGNDGADRFVGGISAQIFNDFRDSMNFREKLLKLYFKDDKYFETFFTSDKYQFDINLYHLGVTKNRTEVARPLHPTFFDGVHAIFVQPSAQNIRNIYRKPFAFQMWYVLLLTWTSIFLASKLMLYIQSKLCMTSIPESSSYNNGDLHRANYILEIGSAYAKISTTEEDNDPIEEEADLNNFDATLWCIGTICQQGWHSLPSATSVRIVLGSGLFLSVVCYSAYTGKIVSELWNVPTPISSLRELLLYTGKLYLLNSSDTSYDILEGLGNYPPETLNKIEFHPMEVVYYKLLEDPGRACVITWLDSLTSLLYDQFSSNDSRNSKVEAYFCETFSSFSFQATSSLFIPKDSELELLFNYRIVVGLERGLIRRYWKAFKRSTTLSCVHSNPRMTTLGFGHVFFAFLILFSGMALSVAIFIFEISLHKIKWIRSRRRIPIF